MIMQNPTASAKKRKEEKGEGKEILLQQLRSLNWAVFCSPSGFSPISIHSARKLLKLHKAVTETGHSQTAIVPFGGALANFRLEEEHTGTISQEPLLILAPTHPQTKSHPNKKTDSKPSNTNKKQMPRRIHHAFFWQNASFGEYVPFNLKSEHWKQKPFSLHTKNPPVISNQKLFKGRGQGRWPGSSPKECMPQEIIQLQR